MIILPLQKFGQEIIPWVLRKLDRIEKITLTTINPLWSLTTVWNPLYLQFWRGNFELKKHARTPFYCFANWHVFLYCNLDDYLGSAFIYVFSDGVELSGKLWNFIILTKKLHHLFLTTCLQINGYICTKCYSLPRCVNDPMVFLC